MVNWVDITSEEQIDDMMTSPQSAVIFKHSTRCPISSMAKNRLERTWDSPKEIYYLDLLKHRDLSNYIAQKSGVEHESPQIIVFKEGKAVYDSSHSAIISEDIIANL
ncbi:MAG: bacillithiol system redox-active protein YtxJ [Chitinophagales bacterium]|nr:bacillithiol system redox-active protein YtxJ [Chitinophagales bacterium]